MFKYINSFRKHLITSNLDCFHKFNHCEFSKRFYDKRSKIKDYLSKEKQEYKIKLMAKKIKLKLEEKEEYYCQLENKVKLEEKEIEIEKVKITEKENSKKIKTRVDKLRKEQINYLKNHSYILHNKKVRNFLVENYSIIPTLFTNSIIQKFMSELKLNQNYKDYFIDWERKSEEEKDVIIKEDKLNFTELEIKEYKYYKPVLDLFVYFINCNFGKELESLKFLSTLSDLTMPHNWFPQARSVKRTIYYHMGPTNSGKTYEALQALMKAKTGVYCAPLRLLAWEVQEKLLANNIKCALKTGQEVVDVENATHFACTVEICPTTVHYDCAVIDEIQLISNENRGSAWTSAFLGLKANEIHLCGDERALSLIYQLCLLTGDKLIRKSYTRLSDLIVEEDAIHSVSQLKKGDCIIAFSKREIFQIKNLINETTYSNKDTEKEHCDNKSDKKTKKKNKLKNKCAVIYGSLPPETKRIQARLFNKGEDGIKFLVATDAIGMGLNLKIKRIIFSQIQKRDFNGTRKLTEHEIKQIAGRAGRSDNSGFVNAFRRNDLDFVRSCCKKHKHKKEKRNINETVLHEGEEEEGFKIRDQIYSQDKIKEDTDTEYQYYYSFNKSETLIEKACLFPPLQIIEEYSDALIKFKNKPEKNSNGEDSKGGKKLYISLSETLKHFDNIARVADLYFMRAISELIKVHKLIEEVKEADIKTQYYFTICPIKVTQMTGQYLKYFLTQFVNLGTVKLPQDFHLENKLFKKTLYKMSELVTFEDIYNVLEIYVWLSYKFEKEFIERELAKVMKDRVSKIIDSIIENSKFSIYSDLRNEKVETSDSEDEEENGGVEKEKQLIEEKNDFLDIQDDVSNNTVINE